MNFLAQATRPAVEEPSSITAAPGSPNVGTEEPPALVKYGQYLPLILGIIILYVFIFRSKKKQDQAKTDLLSKMKKGDRVQTIGGILGTLVEVRDNDVLVKVDETSNTKIKFTRAAIHKVVNEEEK